MRDHFSSLSLSLSLSLSFLFLQHSSISPRPATRSVRDEEHRSGSRLRARNKVNSIELANFSTSSLSRLVPRSVRRVSPFRVFTSRRRRRGLLAVRGRVRGESRADQRDRTRSAAIYRCRADDIADPRVVNLRKHRYGNWYRVVGPDNSMNIYTSDACRHRRFALLDVARVSAGKVTKLNSRGL